jgi:hypothetical protein
MKLHTQLQGSQPSEVPCTAMHLSRPPALQRQHRPTMSARRVTAKAGSRSPGESSTDEDPLLQEFQRVSGQYQRASKQLDLLWRVDKKGPPAKCDCCLGTGHKGCTWCRGTGAMMVGEERFCSLATGCKACPICNSKGFVRCSHCKGTGFRASWMEPGCPV